MNNHATRTAVDDGVCERCELNTVELPADAGECVDCRTATLVWTETIDGAGRRVTRVSICESAEPPQSVVITQRWATERDVDRVGLPAGRIDTIRDMLADAPARAEFTDQFGDDPIDGTTTIEVGEAAILSQQLEPDSIPAVVTLTTEMLAAIRHELTSGGDSK